MVNLDDSEFLSCSFEMLDVIGNTVGLRTKKARSLKKNAEKIFELSPDVPSEAVVLLNSTKDYSNYCDIVVSNLNMPAEKKQEVLETLDISKKYL